MSAFIRAFRVEDAPACGDIVAATPLWQRYGHTAATAAQQLVQADAAGDRVLVLEQDGSVDGFAWIVPRGTFGHCAYLRRIGVRPERRGQQLGTLLLRAVEAEAAKLSQDLYLLVSDFNQSAQRFYLREGFEEVGRLPEFVLPGVTELLYRKRVR